MTFLAPSGGRKDLILFYCGPVVFSIMVNNIMAVYPNKNLLVKYTDDITIRSNFADLSLDEVQNIQRWFIENRMTLNLKKTWEMVVRGNTKKATHEGLIERKGELKLLGVTLHEEPCNWDRDASDAFRSCDF